MPYNLIKVAETETLHASPRVFSYTVVVPLHNALRTIEKTISAISENLSAIDRCIIVENCSTDGSYELVQNLQLDARFHLIKTHLCGAANARNIGVRNANTDFIAFCDADDFWFSDKLNVADYHLHKYEADLFFHALKTADSVEGLAVKLKNLPKKSSLLQDLCIYGDFIPTSSVVISNTNLSNNMFLDNFTHCQDFEAWCYWAYKRGDSLKAVFHENPLGFYEKENGLSKAFVKREISHFSIVWNYSLKLPFLMKYHAIFRNLIRASYRAILKKNYTALTQIVLGNLLRIDR